MAAPSVAAGGSHSLAIGSDGIALAWGSDNNGELGAGRVLNALRPQPVFGIVLPTVDADRRMAAGFDHNVAVLGDGTVWVWGANYFGQLGNGANADLNVPTQLPGITDAVAVSSKYMHALVLRRDGTVWAFGSNGQGQLGDANGDTRPRQVPGLSGVVAVAAGNYHSLALRADGSVWAWGRNAEGELGDGTLISRSQPAPVPGLSGVRALSASTFSMALLQDGTVRTWGSNVNGQLGNGTRVNASLPQPVGGLSAVADIAAGEGHALAVGTDGLVRSWGGARPDQATPALVLGLTSIARIYAGMNHSLALALDGTPWAWGSNAAGQLGDGTLLDRITPVQIRGLLGVRALAAGSKQGLALMPSGVPWAWGSNQYGQLGDGAVVDRALPVPVFYVTDIRDTSAGVFHSLAVRANGSVWSWGANFLGQLGGGATTTSRSTPDKVDGVPDAIAVAAGDYHSLALAEDGRVWGWGSNYLGQLGDGTLADRRYTPVQTVGLSNVVAISARGDHSLALRSDGTVWAWGSNASGERGDASAAPSGVPAQVQGLPTIRAIAAGTAFSLALDTEGRVWAWGAGGAGQWGDGSAVEGARRFAPALVPGLAGMRSISAGQSHALALAADGSVWGWGAAGLLGQEGPRMAASVPKQVPGISAAVALAAGVGHSLAVRSDGRVYAWGAGGSGQLGTGSFSGSREPALVVSGDFSAFLDLDPIASNLPVASSQQVPFFAAAYKSGDLKGATLYVDLRGEAAALLQRPRAAADGYQVFVAAIVQPFALTSVVPEPLVLQLTAGGQWQGFQWPMGAFLSNAALGTSDSVVRLLILRNVDLVSLGQVSVLVGYGTSADEMLSAGRYRTVLSLP